MSDNHSPVEGTIRDARPGEPADRLDAPRLNLSVLNVSHERFRIIKTYAQGGLGVVSIAHDVELDRTVAVKEMLVSRPTDDDVQRFLLEARLTGQLDHPGIPPVYAIGFFEDGRPFYAMRLVDGVTLRSAVKEFHAKYPPPDHSLQRSMQLRHLIGAVVSVCNTLRFAHSKGVLHRDIKPSNIMLGEFGETLLMDWGLAKSQKQSLPYSDLEAKAYQQRKRLEDPEDTGTGSVMGTPHYMSPEQAVGDGDSINQRSEVYSVGATLYSVLTGKPPFTGQTREEILAKVQRGDFQPPQALDARVPPELNAICMKAMALERGDRYADTGELATDIEHWLADESVPCYREPLNRRWQRFFKAHQAIVASLAVLLVTCFLGLILGTYLVSVKHAQAVEAKAQAEEARQTAAAITKQSQEMISHTFISTFNSLMREIPNTERTRLEVLAIFIDQFENWDESSFADYHNRHELANALHERAQIWNDLNEMERAWADMRHALDLFGSLMDIPDKQLRNACTLNRMQLQIDMARSLNEFSDTRQTGEVLAQQVYAWASRAAEANAQSVAYEFHRADAALELGIAKLGRGQLNEAFELISQAESSFGYLLLPDMMTQLTEQLFNGRIAILYRLCMCKYHLARIGYSLHDRQFAINMAVQLDEMLSKESDISSDSVEPALLKWSNRITLIRLGAIGDGEQGSVGKLKEILNEVSKRVEARPNHRGLLQLQLAAWTEMAKVNYWRGRLDLAQADIASALEARDAMKANASTSIAVRTLESELAQIKSDVDQLCNHNLP